MLSYIRIGWGGTKGGADRFVTVGVAEVAAQQGITIPCETRRGHPAKTIVKFADEGHYDLIVIGHSDHSELWGRLLGDTADRISDHAHCSVPIVKN
jgi:nucleotide-binding universal stress UspA family protein